MFPLGGTSLSRPPLKCFPSEGRAYSYSNPFLQYVVRSGAREGVARRGRHIVSLMLISSEWIAAFYFSIQLLGSEPERLHGYDSEGSYLPRY